MARQVLRFLQDCLVWFVVDDSFDMRRFLHWGRGKWHKVACLYIICAYRLFHISTLSDLEWPWKSRINIQSVSEKKVPHLFSALCTAVFVFALVQYVRPKGIHAWNEMSVICPTQTSNAQYLYNAKLPNRETDAQTRLRNASSAWNSAQRGLLKKSKKKNLRRIWLNAVPLYFYSDRTANKHKTNPLPKLRVFRTWRCFMSIKFNRRQCSHCPFSAFVHALGDSAIVELLHSLQRRMDRRGVAMNAPSSCVHLRVRQRFMLQYGVDSLLL